MLQFSSLVGRAMEAANHSKNSAMEAENHVQHGRSSKSHTSRRNILSYFIVVVLAVATIFTSCDKKDGKDNENDTSSLDGFDGVSVQDLISTITLVKMDIALVNDQGPYRSEIIATGPVANNKMSIKFPETVDAVFLYSPFDDRIGLIEKNTTVSDLNARISASFRLLGFSANDQPMGEFVYRNATTSWRGDPWYADRDVSITAEYTDTENFNEFSVVVTCNLQLKKGWNMVYHREIVTGERTGAVTVTTTSPSDGALIWQFRQW